eukprot:GHVU01073142.1.p1 GENE.GHVU01073142.1~~GHVU01073142.1.p1  ORF type:complete len:158 (+),score=11.48 GHVU01073142.1:48-521(+)
MDPPISRQASSSSSSSSSPGRPSLSLSDHLFTLVRACLLACCCLGLPTYIPTYSTQCQCTHTSADGQVYSIAISLSRELCTHTHTRTLIIIVILTAASSRILLTVCAAPTTPIVRSSSSSSGPPLLHDHRGYPIATTRHPSFVDRGTDDDAGSKVGR